MVKWQNFTGSGARWDQKEPHQKAGGHKKQVHQVAKASCFPTWSRNRRLLKSVAAVHSSRLKPAPEPGRTLLRAAMGKGFRPYLVRTEGFFRRMPIKLMSFWWSHAAGSWTNLGQLGVGRYDGQLGTGWNPSAAATRRLGPHQVLQKRL